MDTHCHPMAPSTWPPTIHICRPKGHSIGLIAKPIWSTLPMLPKVAHGGLNFSWWYDMWQVRWPVTDLFHVCLCLFTYVWSLDLFWKLYIVPMLRELTSLSFNINHDTLVLNLSVWGRPSDWGASLHAEPKSTLGSHIWTMGEPIITRLLWRAYTQLLIAHA